MFTIPACLILQALCQNKKVTIFQKGTKKTHKRKQKKNHIKVMKNKRRNETRKPHEKKTSGV
jgi:hypothetical protein